MANPLSKAEADIFNDFHNRLSNIQDWITVEDFAKYVDTRETRACSQKWEIQFHADVVNEALARMVEWNMVEFQLNEKNEGMVKYGKHIGDVVHNGNTYDRVFTKYRLQKLEHELKQIHEKLAGTDRLYTNNIPPEDYPPGLKAAIELLNEIMESNFLPDVAAKALKGIKLVGNCRNGIENWTCWFTNDSYKLDLIWIPVERKYAVSITSLVFPTAAVKFSDRVPFEKLKDTIHDTVLNYIF